MNKPRRSVQRMRASLLEAIKQYRKDAALAGYPPPSMQELSIQAGLSPHALASIIRTPTDMKLSTLLRLWDALGYRVTIWCQGKGRQSYLIEE